MFPIEWFELNLYFDEENSDATMARIKAVKGLWGLHVGNNIIKNEVVRVGSKQPYGLMAAQYCPRSYWYSYDEF